jgi:hypothetical protein
VKVRARRQAPTVTTTNTTVAAPVTTTTVAAPVTTTTLAATVTTTTESPKKECHLCDKLIAHAESFVHRNPNATQAQVKAELEHECSRDPPEQQQCVTFVDSNIALIYSDLKAGKRPHQICADLGVCPTHTAPTSAVPSPNKLRFHKLLRILN